MRTAKGWGVAMDDVILVPTVSETPRAAMVNWLFVYVGFTPTNGMSDEVITRQFERYSKTQRTVLVEVEIKAS